LGFSSADQRVLIFVSFSNTGEIEMTEPVKKKLSNFDKLKLKKISKSESKHIRRLKETARKDAIPEPVKKK
jgi:hypothetical protein